MKCSRCQHENQPQAKFCQECAAPFARTCTNCSNRLPDEAKFCPECAHPVLQSSVASARFGTPESYTPKHLAERILTSRAALEGERKQVTVLFADLKGSMELLADRDPEEARKLLDPVLERMIEAVHRYEGTVNQVMGDGIMALFGAPIALEDHAVRACYAALAMQSAIRVYSEALLRAHGVTVRIRVGLNSGEVVVRGIGSDLHMDYTAVGQTTHLAARMEQLADPAATLLTDYTLKLAEGFVAVKPRGPVPVKGLSNPVQVYELTGAGAARSRLQAAAMRGFTKFVGRSAEMGQINAALERAKWGHGEVVALVGEPGVGKSRLLWEMIHSHRVQDWFVLESASVSYGKASAYGPVIDLLKGYFQIEERDDGRRIREKIAGKLLMLDRQLEPALPALFFLLNVPLDNAQWDQLDPPQRRQRMFEACKRLLLRESQVQPLVVVFEDLHWIDSETQAFLDGLVESLPTVRILLLVNYRPEYQHRWNAKTYYTQIRVDPLGEASTEELLDALLGTDAALTPLRRTLAERTGRNPFFLEESVRTLVETGILSGAKGAYRLGRAFGHIEVPDTVQAILASRIDRLPPEEKRLLQAAAVIGKDVPYALLEAVAELDDQRLHQILADLQAAEFLYETALFPDLEYTFKHALTHEVAYGSMLHERRRALHTGIMQSMEQLYASRLNEQVERLAHHAIRGEQWGAAVNYLRQAGEKAFGHSASREVVSCFEQAIVAASHLPQTRNTIEQIVDLRLALRPALGALNDVRGGLEHVLAAMPLVETLGDPRRECLLHAYSISPLSQLGQIEEAIEHGTRALILADSLKEPMLRIVPHFGLGLAHLFLGLHSKAIDFFLRDTGLSTGEINVAWLGASSSEPVFRFFTAYNYTMCQTDAAYCYAELGEFDKALVHAEHVLKLAGEFEVAAPRANGYAFAGFVYLRQGDLQRAARLLEQCARICETQDVVNIYVVMAPMLGAVYCLSDRASDAVTVLERACAISEPGGNVVWGQPVIAHLVDAYRRVGRKDDAFKMGRRALELSQQYGLRGYEAWTHYLLGSLYPGQGSQQSADAYRQALALAQELSMRPLEAQCRLGLGQLFAQSGDAQQGREYLDSAAQMFREMDMRFWLEKAEEALGAL